jgi:FixJ family two-component response regulator
VLDVRLRGMSGLELQAELSARNVRLPIIMVTGYADVASAVAALKAGAVDFLEKPFSPHVLLERINTALKLDRELRRVEVRRALLVERFETLTPRERQVVDLVAHGGTTKSIAGTLRLRVRTVEVHRARIKQKTKAGNLAELVWMVTALQGP